MEIELEYGALTDYKRLILDDRFFFIEDNILYVFDSPPGGCVSDFKIKDGRIFDTIDGREVGKIL